MKGFRAEGQQLGAARTETVARPGECRRIGHATKLHSFKSHNTHEDPRFGGPIPVTVGTFETKVRPLRGFRVLIIGGVGGHGGGGGWGVGGGGGVPTRDTRPYIEVWSFVVNMKTYSISCYSVSVLFAIAVEYTHQNPSSN